MSQIGFQMSEIGPNYETGVEQCAGIDPRSYQRTGKSAQQLDFRAPQTMTKRHRNLLYDILLERYGCLISTPFYGMIF